MGEHVHTYVELSHPSIPRALDICTDLAQNPVGCHVDFLPQPLSPHSTDPLDYTVLCSSVPNSTLVVNEDQVVEGVDVLQQTYVIIHDECVQEYKN